MRAASGPQIKVTNSRPTKMRLTLGDMAEDPDTSIEIDIMYKKALSKAAAPTAKKMSTLGLQPGKKVADVIDPTSNRHHKIEPYGFGTAEDNMLSQSDLDSIFAHFTAEDADVTMDVDETLEESRIEEEEAHSMGITHEVHRGYMRYYVPKPAGGEMKTLTEMAKEMQAAALERQPRNDAEDDSDVEIDLDDPERENADDGKEKLELVSMDRKLEKAYKFGGTKVPVEEIPEDKFEMAKQIGMQIMSFFPKADVRSPC